ncbi:MAG: PD-(D/E)XK nuclease family protein [Bacteroidota bacterium]
MSDAPKLYHWSDGQFKNEIHMSHLSAYCRCPQQMYQKYIRGVEEGSKSIELVTGSLHHDLMKMQFRRKRDGGEMLSDDDIESYVSEEVEDKSALLSMDDAEEFKRDKDKIIDQAKILNRDYVSRVEPIFVERPFEVKFPEMEYTFAGQIDMNRKLRKDKYIGLSGNEEDESKIPNQHYAVDDLKTSATSPSKNEFFGFKPKPEHWIQHAGYSLGSWIAAGFKASEYKQTMNTTVYLVKTKTSTVKPANFIVTMNEIRFLYEMLKSLEQSLKTGLFPPNPMGWWCAPDKCAAFYQCRKKEIIPFESLFYKEKDDG